MTHSFILKFGKYKGQSFNSTPVSYQNWLLQQDWFKAPNKSTKEKNKSNKINQNCNEIFWDFKVDNKSNTEGFFKARLGDDDINNFTKLIKSAGNREQAQKVIDELVSEYNLDKLPLRVWKTIIPHINLESYNRKANYYTDMNPFKFNNVSTKEDLLHSRYFQTPLHRRML